VPQRGGKVVNIMKALKRSMGENANQKETCQGRDEEEKEHILNLLCI
jgi:hypothetical protein